MAYNTVATDDDITWDVLIALALAAEPRFRRAFLAMVSAWSRRYTVEEIARLLERGELSRLFVALDARGLPPEMMAFRRLMQETSVAAGKRAPWQHPALRRMIGEFDPFFQPNVTRLQDIGVPFLQRVVEQSGDNARQLVLQLQRRHPNITAPELARRLRSMGTFGLDQKRFQTLERYRQLLESNERNLLREALEREFRNPRFDRQIQTAIRTGQMLSSGHVEQMVRAAEIGLVRQRAAAVARTESTWAVDDGYHAAWRQAIETNYANPDDVRRYWLTAKNEKVCPKCLPIPGMNPRGRGFYEMFVTPVGPQYSVGFHTNCQCMIRFVYVPNFRET